MAQLAYNATAAAVSQANGVNSTAYADLVALRHRFTCIPGTWLPVRLDENGDTQCMGETRDSCQWSNSDIECEVVLALLTSRGVGDKGLRCGLEHYQTQRGQDGYNGEAHWCIEARIRLAHPTEVPEILCAAASAAGASEPSHCDASGRPLPIPITPASPTPAPSRPGPEPEPSPPGADPGSADTDPSSSGPEGRPGSSGWLAWQWAVLVLLSTGIAVTAGLFIYMVRQRQRQRASGGGESDVPLHVLGPSSAPVLSDPPSGSAGWTRLEDDCVSAGVRVVSPSAVVHVSQVYATPVSYIPVAIPIYPSAEGQPGAEVRLLPTRTRDPGEQEDVRA